MSVEKPNFENTENEEKENTPEGEAKVEKIITLPNEEEMLARLMEVSDQPHLQERFYPILLKSAGQERSPFGVVMMLTLAIHDYVEGMPPMMANMMYAQAPGFIDALISEPEVAKEARDILQEALSETK